MRNNTTIVPHGRQFFAYRVGKRKVLLQVAMLAAFFGGVYLFAISWGNEYRLFGINLTIIGLGIFLSGVFFLHKADWYREKVIMDLPGFCNYLSQRDINLFLLLRSFSSEEEKGHSIERGFDEEYSIKTMLEDMGVVICLGRPGENMPSKSVLRYYTTHDEWERDVSYLVARSDMIIVRCGSSTGLEWELAEIARKDKLTRTIFLTSKSNINANVRIYYSAFTFRSDPNEFSARLQALDFSGDLGKLFHESDTSMCFAMNDIGPKVFQADNIINAFHRAMKYIGYPPDRRVPIFTFGFTFEYIDWLSLPTIIVVFVLPCAGLSWILGILGSSELANAIWYPCLIVLAAFMVFYIVSTGIYITNKHLGAFFRRMIRTGRANRT